MRAALVGLVLALWSEAGTGLGYQDATPLELRAVRFYRGGQTVVDAFSRVPFALLDPLEADGASYRVTVAVRDSAGLVLLRESWSQTVPARVLTLGGGSTSTVEHFTFAAPPGRYTVEVTVTDSATGRIRRERVDLHAYASQPGVSDLLLANTIRQASDGDTVPQGGEIRKGAAFLRAAGRPVLTPLAARLGYYLEAYVARSETLLVTVQVKSAAGAPIVTTPPRRLPFEAGGGVARGTVDLAGLPPGDYQLEVAVRMRDSVVLRDAEFGMAGFETEAALAAARPPASPDLFAGPEARLDSLYEPLIYLMTTDEQGIYPPLSAEGKRRYLRQFWERRDPTPGTDRNEAREDFYARIAEANRRFREGGAGGVPGWRTDRGRIFIRYGPPDEVLSRPQAGSTGPYEAWKYTQVRSLKYVFLDQTGFGNYALIWTNDRREPSRPNWQALLGAEAVLEVERF